MPVCRLDRRRSPWNDLGAKWRRLDNQDSIAYGTTQTGERFKAAGVPVSRKSLADLVVTRAITPNMGIRPRLGLRKA
jgi:hypothetical protein